ncbi:winged helix-turn-helix domain-containing protein [Streptomyces griseus]
MKRWGLSFQRPDKRAVEQAPEAVARCTRRPGRIPAQRRGPTAVRSSSPTRSGSAPTRSAAARGARGGRHPSCDAAGTGSP